MALSLARLRTMFFALFTRTTRLCRRRRLFGLATVLRAPGRIRFAFMPVMAGADGDGEGEDGAEDEDGSGADEDGDAGDENEDAGAGADGSDGKPEKDWRKELRRYERTTERKRDRDKKELKEAQDKLKEREDEDKSEQEKAVEKAKEEGRSEALTEAEKDRRADRLESACVRQAAKKIDVGEGDEKKKVRFEDPEDFEVFLQRKIAKGDLDLEELFGDDGKIKADVLAEVAKEILEDRPRLAEDSGAGKEKKTPEGGADGGKGKESGGEPSVADLVKSKQQG
jgi:hypothetical protein